MTKLSRETLELLGLSEDACVGEPVQVTLEVPKVGHGQACAEPPTEGRTISLFRPQTFHDCTTGTAPEYPGWVFMYGEEGDVFEGVSQPGQPLGASTLAVDVSEGPAIARLLRGDHVFRIAVSPEGGAPTIVSAEILPSAKERAIASWAPSERPRPPSPRPDDFLAGEACAGWLSTRAHLLGESASSWRRVAAAGLLARLWVPQSRESVDAAFQRTLAQDSPADRVAAWAGALTEEQALEAESAAVAEADLLLERLDEVEAAVEADPAAARSRARDWLHARDDLESARYVLRLARRDAALAAALDDLDASVSDRHSLWASLEDFSDDPHLEAVALECPDCWWGKVAGEG